MSDPINHATNNRGRGGSMQDLVHEAHIAATRHPILTTLLTRLANLVHEQAREIDALRAAIKQAKGDHAGH